MRYCVYVHSVFGKSDDNLVVKFAGSQLPGGC